MHADLPPSREGKCELQDGRTLAYGLYGATEGPIVVVLDGPGSRGLGRAAAASAERIGMRLLVPDRPGFGGSSPSPPGWSFGDVAGDLLAVLRSLGCKRFGILGQSGGTPYALALAAAAKDSVTGLAFVSAISPLGEPDALQDVHGPMRTLHMLARRAPWLLKPLLRAVALRTRKDPKAAARAYADDLPETDRAVLADPQMWAVHVVTAAEAVSSPADFAREARMLAKPWLIDVSAVTAPVAFWVGEQDPSHPPVMSRRMAERLGGAPVTIVPEAATFGLRQVFSDALRHAAAG
jgi:pimeloyl-ACP methyl ester carboxylesterase